MQTSPFGQTGPKHLHHFCRGKNEAHFWSGLETSASHLESKSDAEVSSGLETSASLLLLAMSGPRLFRLDRNTLPHFLEAKTTHFWSGPKPLPHILESKMTHFWSGPKPLPALSEAKTTHFWSGPKPLPHFPRQKRRIFGVDRNLCLTFRGKNDAFLEWTETSASLSEAKTTHFWSGPKPLPHFLRQKRRIFGVDRNLCLTFRGKNDAFLEWTETSASLLRGKNDPFLEWTETSASLSEAKMTHFWSGPKPLPHFPRQKRPIFGVDRNLCLTF